MFAKKLTCQCCGTKYNCLEGYIANHGHKKVKASGGRKGYITSGCMGSRAKPFENDRSVLGEMITNLKEAQPQLISERNWLLDDENKQDCRTAGIVIDGDYEINEEDLDRRGLDGDDAEEILQDIQYHMALIGVHDYRYGSMTWDAFWAKLVSNACNAYDSNVRMIEISEASYASWKQTITDAQWEHNRAEVMHPKRSKATTDGWVARSGGKVEQKVAPTTMYLREFGQLVAEFSTAPNGRVFEAVPNTSGSWDVIDSHDSWEVVRAEYGDKLTEA